MEPNWKTTFRIFEADVCGYQVIRKTDEECRVTQIFLLRSRVAIAKKKKTPLRSMVEIAYI
jgi:hypothetical protein